VLSAAVPQETRKFVVLGAGAFTILAVCRLGSLVISATNKYRADREARRTFHLTPISQRLHGELTCFSDWHPPYSASEVPMIGLSRANIRRTRPRSRRRTVSVCGLRPGRDDAIVWAMRTRRAAAPAGLLSKN
jgi:hypothetical protein